LKLSRSDEGVAAEEVWSSMDIQFQMNRGGAILVGESVFGVIRSNRYRADGKAVPACIDLMTGKTKWRSPKAGPGEGEASAIYADGQLYFRYDDGVMALVEASPQRYKLNGTFKIPTVTGLSDRRYPPTPPAISDGRLYMREKEMLFVYDVRMKN
jgi:outer membrane protein assembly factor BamB